MEVLENLLIFSEKKLFLYSRKWKPRKFPYILGNGNPEKLLIMENGNPKKLLIF